jgi:hypothetical protein
MPQAPACTVARDEVQRSDSPERRFCKERNATDR